MATKIIAASLSLDTGNSGKSISDLKTSVKDLTKEFESAKAGSDDQAAAFKKLKDAQDQLAKSTQAANDQFKATNDHFGNIKQGLSNVQGPLKTASEGVSTLGDAFKALLANPVVLVITALVGILALLYKSFTNTAEGGEKMEQVFAGVKAAAKAVLDAIFELGGAIIKFFSGDFKGAFEQAKGAITGVVDAVVNAYTQTAKLTALLQQLHKDQLVADLAEAKRGTDLAKLREEALDPDVPVAKRKILIAQLAAIEEKASTEDIARAKKTADAKIALLSIGTDAAKKNRDEIAQIQIDEAHKETDAANEKRRIDRLAKQADKEEKAKDKADAAAATAEEKKNREQLEAFQAQLRKLTQENVLAGITDQYAKEKQLLENKIEDEQALIQKEFNDGKITRAQFEALNAQQAISSANQRKALEEKHKADVATQEEKFQKQLSDIRGKTAVDGIIDQQKKEQVQLEISHQQELAQAIKDYGANSDKFFQIKQAIDAEYAAKQAALDEKNAAAAAKKKLDDAKKHTGTVLSDPKSTFKARQDAIDAEQAQFKAAFDAKRITESEYNDEVEHLAQDRIKIKQEEQKQQSQLNNAIGDAFNTLADIAGKQTAAGKALAIAGTTIKTFQAAFDAFAGMVSEIPGPVGIALGIVAAAGAAAAGIKAVQNILAVQVPGQASGGGSVPSGITLPTAPVAPTQSSTKLDQSSINQIGLQNKTQPVQAFVVESSSAAAVNRAARLQNASILGGN